jgi:hypothetical protein
VRTVQSDPDGSYVFRSLVAGTYQAIRELKDGATVREAKLDAKKPVALLIKSEDGQRYITFRPEVG